MIGTKYQVIHPRIPTIQVLVGGKKCIKEKTKSRKICHLQFHYSKRDNLYEFYDKSKKKTQEKNRKRKGVKYIHNTIRNYEYDTPHHITLIHSVRPSQITPTHSTTGNSQRHTKTLFHPRFSNLTNLSFGAPQPPSSIVPITRTSLYHFPRHRPYPRFFSLVNFSLCKTHTFPLSLLLIVLCFSLSLTSLAFSLLWALSFYRTVSHVSEEGLPLSKILKILQGSEGPRRFRHRRPERRRRRGIGGRQCVVHHVAGDPRRDHSPSGRRRGAVAAPPKRRRLRMRLQAVEGHHPRDRTVTFA